MKIRRGAIVQFQGKLVEWPPFPQADGVVFRADILPGGKSACVAPGFGDPKDYGHGPVIVGDADLLVSEWMEGGHACY